MIASSKNTVPTCSVHRVDVVESAKQQRRGWIQCRIGEHLVFDPYKLGAYCLAQWDTRVYDAFVVSAAVQFCDHTKARSSIGWGRDFELRIPVHDPELWNGNAVSSSLNNALNFLTGDRWTISFVARKSKAAHPHQEHFSVPEGTPIVMPFSDGLDSHIVAGLMRKSHGDNLLLVRQVSKQSKAARRDACKYPFAEVPYRISYNDIRARESSGRSRGFRFALLSGIAACLSGAKEIIIPESGQGVLAPALIPVGHAYEDYRNHPLFTQRMEIFLQALFGTAVRYAYPHLWKTKGETLTEFKAAYPDSDSWMATRSCWQQQRHVSVGGRMRQCGVCAACMLRRLSIHAANCFEDSATYVWNDLCAPVFEEGADPAYPLKKTRGAMYEYAIAGVLHLDHFAGLTQPGMNDALVDRHVCQLSQSIGINESIVRTKFERLVQQHRNEWDAYLESLGSRSFIAQWASRAE